VNPYALLGVITLSTSILAGMISFLVLLGISLLVAIVGVYLFAVIIMIWMQKCATRLYDDGQLAEQSGCVEEQIYTDVPIIKPINNVYWSSSDQSRLFLKMNERHNAGTAQTTSTDQSAVY